MENFAALGPLQYLGIAISGVLLTATFLFFLLREQKNIKATDGTSFSSEEACKAYEAILVRINTLYLDAGNKSSTETFGLEATFIKLLKEEGFKDSKTLIKYKDEFKKLYDVLNQDITT